MSKKRAALRTSRFDYRFFARGGTVIRDEDGCLEGAAFPGRAASSSRYRSISTSAAPYTSTPRTVGTLRHGAHPQTFFVLRGCDCKFCDLLRIQPEKPEVPRGNRRASTLAFTAGNFSSTLFCNF